MEGVINSPINESPAPTRREELTRTVEQWVSQTFYGTLLRQMRNSPFRSELFDGGRGGQAFASLFDQQLAERMARGAGGGLVGSIVRQLDGTRGAERAEMRRDPVITGDPDNPFRNVRIHVADDIGT